MGANSEEESGLYFSWGNTEGHAEGSGYNFSQDEYNTTPGAAITTNLSLSQDAARANLGAAWRMPTVSEFRELFENCTSIWTTMNGVPGRLFTSKVNGNTLFIPAAGYYEGTSPHSHDSYGYLWASTYQSTENARVMYFYNLNINPQSSLNRHYGLSVRAVLNL